MVLFLVGVAVLTALADTPSQGQPGGEGRPAAADVLPSGAVRRLGTTHTRLGNPIVGLGLADGKLIAAAGQDEVVVWDATDGRRVTNAAVPQTERAKFTPGDLTLFSTVSHPTGRLCASADGKSVVLVHNRRAYRYPIGIGGPPEALSASLYGAALMAVTASPPAETLFGLTDRGHLVEYRGKDPRWIQLLLPPVAGSRLALAGGGGIVAFAGEDGRVRLWDTTKKEALAPLDVPGVHALAVSADGRWLATNSSGLKVHGLRVWRIGETKPVHTWQEGYATVLALSQDGSLLAGGTATTDGKVSIYDTKSGQLLHTLTRAGDTTTGLAFLPDGRGLATAGKAGVVRLLDPRTGRSLRPEAGHAGPVRGVIATPDGGTITGGADGAAVLWDAVGREVRRFTGHTGEVVGLALSPDGKTLFTAGGVHDASVRAWDVGSGTELRKYAPNRPDQPDRPALTAESLSLSADGRTLAVGFVLGALRGGIHLLDAQTFQPAAGVVAKLDGRGHDVAFAADGRLVAREGTSLKVWDTAKGVVVHTVARAGGNTREGALAVSPDGKQFSAPIDRAADGRIARTGLLGVWSVETGELVRRVEMAPRVPLSAVAFAPDGKTVAAGTEDGRVRVVDVTTTHTRGFAGHLGPVRAVAFAADGKTLVTGGADTTALVWDLTRP